MSNQQPPKSENPSDQDKDDAFEKFMKDLNESIFNGKPFPGMEHARKV